LFQDLAAFSASLNTIVSVACAVSKPFGFTVLDPELCRNDRKALWRLRDELQLENRQCAVAQASY
jgi:hypothetical protein